MTIPEDSSPAEKRNPARVLRLSVVLVGGAVLLAWLLNTPPGLLGKSDAVAYAVCHRISSHSFYFGSRPFSLCARCSGQYLGFLWGFSFQVLVSKKRAGFPSRWMAALLGGMIVFYLGDGLNSFFYLYPGLENWSFYEPQNILRLYAGLGMGLAVSGFYFPLMGQTLWEKDHSERSLQGLGEWLPFGSGAILLGLLVIWENPLVSYFLILSSTAGLLALLTLLYSVIWILLFKKENSFTTVGELGWWIGAGITTAMVQIALMDVVRYLLTGTWSGFLEY